MPANRDRGLTAVLSAAQHAVRRFPLVVAAGGVAAVAASVLVGSGQHPDALRLLATATLALPLLFTVTVIAARRPGSVAHWLLLLVALLALAGFWGTWPGWTDEMRGYRYVQLSAAFHLLAAFAPFVGSSGSNAFWQFNKTLFLRALMAAIYTGVLYVGLAIALAAINKLFGVPLPSATYPRLWFLLAFVFSTLIFVGGVPEDLDALAMQSDYPNALRAFTQFVLVPLVAIYLLILTLYLVKVLVTQQWPSGWIGYLVSSVAVAGILSWLLVHPLEERPEYAWVKPFTRGFYVAMMPAIVMLWLATWQRVQQYGITERRYGLIVLSIWLACIAVYFTFSRSRNIKLIPATLCLVIVGTFAGPSGAYSVSRASQMGRLRAVLERDSLLVGGRLVKAGHEVSDSDRVAISSGFKYLVDVHGYRSVEGWFPDSLRRLVAEMPDSLNTPYANGRARAITFSINVAFALAPKGPGPIDGGVFISYYSQGFWPATIPIGGFTHLVQLSAYQSGYPKDTLVVDPHTSVHLSADDATLHILRDGQSALDLPLRAAIDSAAGVPRPQGPRAERIPTLRVEANSGGIAAVLFINHASGTDLKGTLKLDSFGGELFLRLPK